MLEEYGGQWSSIEWVFSPRGPDGRPLPLFDRTMGDMNPEVVQHWRRFGSHANVVMSLEMWQTFVKPPRATRYQAKTLDAKQAKAFLKAAKKQPGSARCSPSHHGHVSDGSSSR